MRIIYNKVPVGDVPIASHWTLTPKGDGTHEGIVKDTGYTTTFTAMQVESVFRWYEED